MLLTHGTADDEDLLERTEGIADDLPLPASRSSCTGARARVTGRSMTSAPTSTPLWLRDFFMAALAGN